MTYRLDERKCANVDFLIGHEWVLTNGIGGYAMGTAAGINSRRYHGHLIAAVKPPTHRMVLLAGIDAFLESGSTRVALSSNQYPGAIYPDGHYALKEFAAGKSVVWRFQRGSMACTKRMAMHPSENAITVEYRNTGKATARLILNPLVCHKPHHENFHKHAGYPDDVQSRSGSTVIRHGGVSLWIQHEGADVSEAPTWYYQFEHVRERERGLPDRDDLFCPCELAYDLRPGEAAVLCFADQPTEALPIPAEE